MVLPQVSPELAARLANYTIDDRARALLRKRDGSSICPSDVARVVGGEEWRDQMDRVRAVAGLSVPHFGQPERPAIETWRERFTAKGIQLKSGEVLEADLVGEAERELGVDIEVLARPQWSPGAARARP